jgi:cytochrome c-type biogenesis protein CcmH
LAQEPDNPKALLYGGFSAAARGDFAAARSRWQALKEMHPPAQIDALLDARIAELGPAPTGPGAAPTPTGGAAARGTPGGGAASGAGVPAVPVAGDTPGAAAAEVTVNISIAPALKARLTREAPLFVFAREPGAPGPPLAAKRLTSAAIGTQIHLSAADSMIPGRVLVSGRSVSITARVSFSGQPLPAAGDLYGELAYDVGHDGPRDLVIDRIAN